MKRWLKRIGIGIAALLAIVVALGAARMYTMVSPTTGPRIAAYGSPRKALLVIDVQEDYTNPGRALFSDHAALIAAVNRVIDAAPRLGLAPVYIRQVLPDNALGHLLSGSRAIEGTPGARTDARVHMAADAPDFTKERSDAFSSAALDEWLRAHQVDEVYLVGLDGKYCVNKTARGALNRGYKVTIVRDAVTTRSGPLDPILADLQAAGARVATLSELGI